MWEPQPRPSLRAGVFYWLGGRAFGTVSDRPQRNDHGSRLAVGADPAARGDPRMRKPPGGRGRWGSGFAALKHFLEDLYQLGDFVHYLLLCLVVVGVLMTVKLFAAFAF